MKTKGIKWWVVVVTMLTGQVVITAQETMTISIDLNDRRAPVPAALYGIFMEEISHAFDGGIYAELVQNRSFEEGIVPPGMKLVGDADGKLRMELESLPPGVPEERWPMPWPWSMNCGWDPERALVGWSLENEGGTPAAMELTADHPMNAASQRSLRISIPKKKREISVNSLINTGYWGMNILAGEEYDLTFYLRPYRFKGNIRVALEGSGGVLAGTDLGRVKRSTRWIRHNLTLKAEKSDPAARLVITLEGSGELQIDWVSLFPPTFGDRPNGLRRDLAQLLADMKPDFIRYPGGCYVEGLSWESAPDWRTMVCPPEERPGQWGYWKYRSTDGFGYHEFLEFCEQLGADAMYVAFAGMTVHPDNNWPLDNIDTIIRQTLDAIEYAIGPTDSPWGSRRALMGHPEPFRLKYVEIGNEHPPAIYGDYYVKFRDAIKAKYPDMVVIMSMYWSGLNRPAIERAGDENIDMVDEHAYRDAQWIRSNFDYFDRYERTPWSVYVGEYASHHAQGDLLCALSDATYLMMMEKNGDLVKMASYAPLFCNVNDRSWGVNLIEFDASRSFAHASYYVQKSFNEHRPDVNLGITVENSLQIDTLKNLLAGRIGLGSWKTAVEYRDFEVVDGAGNPMYNHTSHLKSRWGEPVAGSWSMEGESIRQSDSGVDAARIFIPNLPFETGEIRVKARRTEGSEGFLILFNAEKDDRFFFANYGAAGNAFHEVQCWGTPRDYAYKRYSSTRGEIENNRWYDLRVVVKRDRAEMYLDGELVSVAGLTPVESLFATAGLRTGSEEVVTKAVNYLEEPVKATLHLSGAASVQPTGSHIVITSGDLHDRNTLDEPQKIIPEEKPLNNCSNQFSVTLPPRSVNLIRVTVRK